jgi:hypothetical protein
MPTISGSAGPRFEANAGATGVSLRPSNSKLPKLPKKPKSNSSSQASPSAPPSAAPPVASAGADPTKPVEGTIDPPFELHPRTGPGVLESLGLEEEAQTVIDYATGDELAPWYKRPVAVVALLSLAGLMFWSSRRSRRYIRVGSYDLTK